jgi:hypothetical protein
MHITSDLADKILRLVNGERVPASSLQYDLIDEMYKAEIIRKEEKRNDKVLFYIDEPSHLVSYIERIGSSAKFPEGFLDTLRAKIPLQVIAPGTSTNRILKKTKLEGFFVASYEAIQTKLSGNLLNVNPQHGTSLFVSNTTEFFPAADIRIVGVERADVFTSLHRLSYLFQDKKTLFVFTDGRSSRLVKWLKKIPNEYLHFTDFDFSSISAYYSRYKRPLKSRCDIFIPADLESQLKTNGKTDLYDSQLKLVPSANALKDKSISRLVHLIHKYQKGLEQHTYLK